MLFLPPIRYDEEEFLRETESEERHWTPEALNFGKRLVAALGAMADALSQSVQMTPPPEWSRAAEYRLTRKANLKPRFQPARRNSPPCRLGSPASKRNWQRRGVCEACYLSKENHWRPRCSKR